MSDVLPPSDADRDEALRRIAVEAEAKTGTLDLSGLAIEHLPDEIRGLTHLVQLKCCGFFDDKIFLLSLIPLKNLEGLEALTNLKEVDCRYTQITSLAGLEGITGLSSLDCRYTQITSLAGLEGLNGLTSLDCGWTQITSLAGLEGLTGLSLLNCGGTQITSLAGLEGLTGLSSLNCSDTQITSLAGLEGLTGLTSLDCRYTQITSLAGLKGLTGLTSLDCSETQITSLAGLKGLTGLSSLDCGGTQITSLAGLEGLTGLTSLDCRRTQITSLAGLEGLTGLTSLNCGGTQITSLAGLEGLTGLSSLDCSDTQITSLAGLEGLTSLTSLDCSFTWINSLAGLEGLTGLTSLNCGRTEITSLAGLEGLTSLTSLDCSGTRLDDQSSSMLGIPAHLRSCLALPHLQRLHTGEARLFGVPDELQGWHVLESLRAYIAALDANPREVRAIRLFILGNGGVGKTQVRRTLLNQPFSKGWDSTHGIETEQLTLFGPEGEKHRIDLWDFGGQEVYHGTHALFLQKTAIFVLVWNPQMETGNVTDPHGTTSTNQPLAYWLDYARQFGGDEAQIIILQTRCGKTHGPTPPPVVIPDDMAGRVQVLQIDNEVRDTRGGLMAAVLKGASDIIDLTGVTHLPGSWLDIGDELVKLRKEEPETRLLPMARYRQICEDAGLTNGQDTLLRYLDATAKVLHNPALAGEAIILDPAWALDGIYALLQRDAPSYTALRDNAGRFTPEDLGRWFWNDCGLDSGEQQALLQFMTRAGLCFVHRDATDHWETTRYIAPAFLPATPLPMVERAWRAADANTLGVTWGFDLLHDGLAHALLSMIGELAMDDADYWRTGAQFYDGTSNCVARLTIAREPSGWSGAVSLQIQSLRGGEPGAAGAKLLKQLSDRVDDCLARFGEVPVPEIARPTRQPPPLHKGGPDFPDAAEFGEDAILPIRPTRPEPEYFVSYAWCHDPAQHDSEQPVIDFVKAAKAAGFEVLRDRDQGVEGDQGKWVEFVERMASPHAVVFAFVGKTYLERFWGCYEMSNVYHAHGYLKFPQHFRALALEGHVLETDTLVGDVQTAWAQRALPPAVPGAPYNPEAEGKRARLDCINRCLPHALTQLREGRLTADPAVFLERALEIMAASKAR